jgi:type I restriction enzyme, S subunit
VSDRDGQQLPPGWDLAAIEDLFAPLDDGRMLHQGWSPQCEKEPSTNEGDWGVLRTTAIQPGVFLPEHNKLLPADLAPRPRIEVASGDLLITCAGPRSRCGIACLVRNSRRNLMMSGKMYRFRVPKQHIDPRYIEAFLQTSAACADIDRMKTGGSDSGLNLTHERFRRLKVPVAPYNEQCQIVETYEELASDIDAGIAALERVRAKLKLYRASVLKAAVEGALTADWRAQHPQTEPASELLRRILVERRRRWEEDQLAKFKAKGQVPQKDWKAKYQEPVAADISDLPPLSEGWCWASLDQVYRVERGRFSVRPRNDPRYYGGKIPFVQIAELPREGGTIQTYTQTLNAKGLAVSKRFPVGTVLIAIVGATIGNTGILGFESCCPDSLVALQSSLPVMLRYVELYLRTRKLTMRAGASASGGQPNINLELLQPLPWPMPPLEETEFIVEAVEDQFSIIDHLEADIEAKLKASQSLRQSILRHAFSGQLVPQDPNDEPASELLKRIAAERATRTREAAAAKRPVKPAAGPRTAKRRRPRKVLEPA